MYTFVQSTETLTISGVIAPSGATSAITSLRYGVIQDGFFKTDHTVSVVPDANGAVSVSLLVPQFDAGCSYVGLIAEDIAGNNVPSGFSGSASTPTVVYIADQGNPGGFLFAKVECKTGFDKAKWCKKPKLKTLYAKKIGKPFGSSKDDSIWCISCPFDEHPPAEGQEPSSSVPTTKTRTEPRSSIVTRVKASSRAAGMSPFPASGAITRCSNLWRSGARGARRRTASRPYRLFRMLRPARAAWRTPSSRTNRPNRYSVMEPRASCSTTGFRK